MGDTLTGPELSSLVALRRALHQRPEMSGAEVATARTIAAELRALNPSAVVEGLGGHGVAAVFDSGVSGPTVLFRAELDALPIVETGTSQWTSLHPGFGHLCGHDGHMTMLLALGRLLARRPIARGRAVLMFQPSEEDGSGARAVVADPAYAPLAPDYAFAIHNEPGRPFGVVSTQAGLLNCASQGLFIRLTGRTAHAADPQDGLSPAAAVAALVPAFATLGTGGALNETFRLATLTHVRIGEPTFGIAPGEAVMHLTLRATADAALVEMAGAARAMVRKEAAAHGLSAAFEDRDVFAATVNDAEAVAIARRAMDLAGVPHDAKDLPMRASEDFGVFGQVGKGGARAAMLCLGPGEDHAPLHAPDYDFPDTLIPIGTTIFAAIARELLGAAGGG